MQLASAVDVVARCIVRKDRTVRTRTLGKFVHGVIAVLPEVGNSLVIYRRNTHHRLVTSPAIRVLRDGESIYVETRNSIYHVVLSR